jgi:flagellin-like hook-associated protein FlgL
MMQSLQSHLSDLQLAAQKNISDVGDADVSDIVVKLQSYTQMLQLTLASFAQINNVSLLDYLH